jgi:hypothetical protein
MRESMRRPKMAGASKTSKLTAFTAITLSLASPAWSTSTAPDAGNYTATNNAVYSFIDLTTSNGSASVLANTDDGVALITLPFAFVFYGKSYTMACASSNGLLYFVTAAAACNSIADFQNLDLTVASAPGDLPAVAPYWTDLSFQVPGGGAVYYQSQGNPGSRQFIIEWVNAYPQATILSANPVTFEAILNESSNQVLLQYKTVNLGSANPAAQGAQSTVGFRDSGGNSNSRETQWSYDAPVLSDASVILFTPGYSLIPSNQITATVSAFGYNRGTKLYTGTITLKNVSSSTLAGPFQVLLNGLPSGVTMANSTNSYGGNPYVNVSAASLSPGQSVAVTVQFTDPSNTAITFKPTVYSGTLK